MQICIKNGDLPIKNGDLPIKNGDFPLKMVIYLLKMVIFPLNQQNWKPFKDLGQNWMPKKWNGNKSNNAQMLKAFNWQVGVGLIHAKSVLINKTREILNYSTHYSLSVLVVSFLLVGCFIAVWHEQPQVILFFVIGWTCQTALVACVIQHTGISMYITPATEHVASKKSCISTNAHNSDPPSSWSFLKYFFRPSVNLHPKTSSTSHIFRVS